MDDLPRDVADALEDFNRDVECFWAEQEEGRTCEKWELWAAEDECWQSGMIWDWEDEECLSQDEANRREEERCWNEGNYWL